MTTVVQVEVHPDTETLYTRVSRDVWEDYYEIPEPLVVAYETARVAFEGASAAIVEHIEKRHLQVQYVEGD